jgi:foldase protein PrsA
LLGDLGNSKLEEIAFSLEPGMISEPTYDDSVTKGIGYWILKVTEKDDAKGRHVWGMLLGSWDEAVGIKAKLEAGEDFSTLAKQYSQHLESKEQGGDLGWTRQGFGNRILAGFAEQLEPGGISKPVTDQSVQTKGGYWLVRVEERDANRQLEDEVRGTLVLNLFQDWVSGLEKNSLTESYLTEEEKAWAVARVLKDRGQ